MTNWMPRITEMEGPLYRLVADAIQTAIGTGELLADQKLPTHRALADHLDVTTGTITRAYAEAERRGLVYGVVGSGMYVRGKEALSGEWHFLEKSDDEGQIKMHVNTALKENRAGMLAEAMATLSSHPAEINYLMDYQPDVGILTHRQMIVQWIARDDWRPSADQVIITNGGQHGIMVALMALTHPGDTVLTESLVYPGFAAIARQIGLQVRPVPMDAEGMTPEALEAACKQHAPRAVFCSPSVQNPTTATMSLSRRKAIIEICQRYDVMIVEDEVSVGVAENTPTPLAAMAPDRVLYVGTFSKTLTAGLRVGYCVASPALQARIGAAVRACCWMVSPLMSGIICEWIRNGSAQAFMKRQRQEILARTQIALEKLKGYDVKSYPGAMHIWVNLPEPWRADEFEAAAKDKGVFIMGATTFSISRAYTYHGVRISLSAELSRARVEEGLDILVDLLKRERFDSGFAVV